MIPTPAAQVRGIHGRADLELLHGFERRSHAVRQAWRLEQGERHAVDDVLTGELGRSKDVAVPAAAPADSWRQEGELADLATSRCAGSRRLAAEAQRQVDHQLSFHDGAEFRVVGSKKRRRSALDGHALGDLPDLENDVHVRGGRRVDAHRVAHESLEAVQCRLDPVVADRNVAHDIDPGERRDGLQCLPGVEIHGLDVRPAHDRPAGILHDAPNACRLLGEHHRR